ncbi:MAG: hypothetical protein Ct9H300mP8_09410 [Gammaproteobacteria bacterium]|nr:MAG: hypothetical protein Ct9H300mP8_09410 [Gammaproteobacteria bacterium]
MVRGDRVLIAHDELEIKPEDHVILFLTDKSESRLWNDCFRSISTFFDMHLNAILGVTGTLLMLFSLTLLMPILVAVIYVENTFSTFGIAFAITLATGFFCGV